MQKGPMHCDPAKIVSEPTMKSESLCRECAKQFTELDVGSLPQATDVWHLNKCAECNTYGNCLHVEWTAKVVSNPTKDT